MKKAANFLQLFLLLSAVTGGNSWTLEVNHNEITPGISTNIVFDCHHDSNDLLIDLNEIYRIRISKLGVNNMFTQIAEASARNPKGITTLTGATVTGNLNKIVDTFIRLEFELATKDILGQYICEVDGFDQFQEVKAVKTEQVSLETSNINLRNLSNELHDLEKIVKYDHNYLTSLNKSLETMLSKIFDKLIHSHSGNNQDNEDYSIVNSVDKLTDLLKFVSTYSKYAAIYVWPGGEYSLLKPDTGCPGRDSSVWQSSYLTVATIPSAVKDSGSKEFNLFGNVFQSVNNKPFVHFEFCSMVTANKLPQWPSGSYCIQSHTWEKCPTGFSGGYTWYGKYGTTEDTIINLPGFDDNQGDDYTKVYYCCRKDAEVGNAMVLPRQKPFYLFRYGGECQEVVGMKATGQWINMNLYDYGSGTYEECPDVNIENDNFMLALCYYIPVF